MTSRITKRTRTSYLCNRCLKVGVELERRSKELGNHRASLCQCRFRVIDQIEEGGDGLFVRWDRSIDLLDLALVVVKGYLFPGQGVSLFATLLAHPRCTCPQCARHVIDVYGVDGFLAWSPSGSGCQ